MRRVLTSPLLLGVVLFGFSAGFPPFDDVTEVDLTAHMLQHVLIVLAGVLVAYPIFRVRRHAQSTAVAWASLLGASTAIVFWHLPVPWDTAVLSPGVHLAEHFTFLGVGLLIGSWIQLLSDSAKIGALLAAFFGHMFYAVLLISPWNVKVYALYSLPDQTILGWALLLTGPSLLVGVAYLVLRNPAWLSGLSGGGLAQTKRETAFNRLRIPKWVVPSLTLTLVLIALAYFGMTAVALSTGSPPATGRSSVVQIVETPLSWQFAPQRIHVVLGVNSTVTWVSRSLSFDTVTSKSELFDSGPIGPGGSYSYTFTAPGTYEYYCVYHPWMSGTVTVALP